MTSGLFSEQSSASALSVSQICERIKATVSASFPTKIQVVGEISNLSDRKHWFFTLKDDSAALRCVCFASSVKRIKTPVQDGMQVVVSGRVDFYASYGSVQIYVDDVQPVGQGALELALKKLMEELREAGYFTLEHKLELPVIPRKIAVVTSRSAAALQDVINTANRRWDGCQLYLVDVRVQGEQAAGQISNAITALSKSGQKLAIDGIILTRGGGSIEDLWAFNERVVADAIYNCKLPIVAAIGHETDTTIAELVADVRCATPTQAAMQLVPDKKSLIQQVEQLDSRLTLLTQRYIEQADQRLNSVARHALFQKPKRLIEQAEQHLKKIAKQMPIAINRRYKNESQRLESLQRHLEAIGPKNVLQRGFSYTIDIDGNILKSAKKVKKGDEITTVLSDGKVLSRISGKSKTSYKQRSMKKNRALKTSNSQPQLF